MQQREDRGYVIAIDGPDGVGKTTQINLLCDYLKQKHTVVHCTRASGGTPIGEELRKASLSKHPRHPETDLYISLAMHTELGYDFQKRKAAKEVVLVDRSPLAIVAYNGYGSQMPNKAMAFKACEDLFLAWQIDLLLFLNAPQRILDERRQKRDAKDYFEQQNDQYHLRVREGYHAGLKFLSEHSEIGSKVASVEASGSVEQVHAQLLSSLALLGL